MKIIQSYIGYKTPNEFKLEKNDAYIMMLSSLLLKKHYGNVTLYTNEVNFNLFSKIGFPYEYNIDVVNETHSRIYSMAKLGAMRHQTEPFIHADLDTFIFKKPNIERKKSPFIFSHPDIQHLVEEIEQKKDTIESIILSNEYYDIYDTYLVNYFNLSPKLNSGTWHDWPGIGYIKLSDIPNMNFIAIKDDVNSLHEAIDNCFGIFKESYLHESDKWNDAAFIEQFCLPIYLKKLNKEYNEICNLNSDTEFNYDNSQFLLPSNPYIPMSDVDYPNRIENGQFENMFPFRGKINQYCSECWQNHNVEWNIESIDDFKERLNFDSISYYHVGGGSKNIGILQAMIIGHIIKEFGVEYVMKVHNFFKNEIYPLQNIQNQISQGEYIYEHLTENRIFTKNNQII